MDSLPPDDPNPNQNQAGKIKDVPPDGRRLSRRGPMVNASGEREMEIIDLRDQGVIVIMFLIGLVNYLLRERCTC